MCNKYSKEIYLKSTGESVNRLLYHSPFLTPVQGAHRHDSFVIRQRSYLRPLTVLQMMLVLNATMLFLNILDLLIHISVD